MSDGSEKRPLTKMLWSVSIKTRTFASVNTCNGCFYRCLKLLKQYRMIEQMCSDAHNITLRNYFYIDTSYLTWSRTNVTHYLKQECKRLTVNVFKVITLATLLTEKKRINKFDIYM